ncbi:Imm63 family immunity protein [Undibacterium danionis]|uniref:Imm63 family immunity protein n=1 Tax=Undibacterium danionis TaxID=1812100 RepID=A0ABV6II75_9BURK
MMPLNEIQRKIYKMGQDAAIHPSRLILRTGSSGDGVPYIDISNGTYDYVIAERGVEFSRRITNDLDEFLYYFLDGVISMLSFEYEFAHRKNSEYLINVAFDKKVELMSLISKSWGIRTYEEIKHL